MVGLPKSRNFLFCDCYDNGRISYLRIKNDQNAPISLASYLKAVCSLSYRPCPPNSVDGLPRKLMSGTGSLNCHDDIVTWVTLVDLAEWSWCQSYKVYVPFFVHFKKLLYTLYTFLHSCNCKKCKRIFRALLKKACQISCVFNLATFVCWLIEGPTAPFFKVDDPTPSVCFDSRGVFFTSFFC